MTNSHMTTFLGVRQHSYATCDAALAASVLCISYCTLYTLNDYKPVVKKILFSIFRKYY